MTKQTGSLGRLCKKVLVVEKLEIDREAYFALVMDGSFKVYTPKAFV